LCTFNRTIEDFKKKINDVCDIDKPETTEQTLSTNQNKIKATLDLLRSTVIFPVNEACEIQIEICDFNEALKKVVPSSKREGFVTVPNVTWDDIGSLKKIRQELHMAMLVSILRIFVFY